MAVREFDGVDDNIVCATGGLSGMTHGTVAVLVQRRATGDFYALFGVNDVTNALLGSVLIWNDSDWTWFTSGGGSKSTTPSPLNTWALLVVRKDTGSATPRFSIFNYSSSTWSHEDGDTAQGDWTAPGAGGNIAFSDADNDFPAIRVAARAAWADSLPWSADATGDAAIEAAGLETAYQNWIDAAPDAAWRFNQDQVSTPVADDTGNGAGQTAITGTTVVVGDDPPGFDFSLSSGITGSAASIAPAGQAAAAGAVTVTGSSAAVAPAAVASGSGAVGNPPRTGSAVSVAAAAVATGSATVAVAGSGAAVAPAGLVAGAGLVVISGVGASVALAGVASGSAVHGVVVLTGTVQAAAPRVPTATAARPRAPSATAAVPAVPTAGGAP